MRNLDDPRVGGVRPRSAYLAYERQQRLKMLLIGGICIAVGTVALVVFLMRGGF